MPAQLWVMLLTCFAIMISAPFLLAFALLLMPGRKGKLRTKREIMHDGLSMGQAKSLYSTRLARDNFEVYTTADPQLLHAVRPGAPRSRTHSHSDKPILVEIEFTSVDRAVRVQVAGCVKDFIFYDTGEGRLLDLTIDRLLSDTSGEDTFPVVPNHSFTAMSSLAIALIAIAIMAVLWTKSSSASGNMAALWSGATLASLGSILASREAIKQIRLRPTEILGKGIAVVAMIFGSLGLAIGVIGLYVRFWATLSDAFKRLLH